MLKYFMRVFFQVIVHNFTYCCYFLVMNFTFFILIVSITSFVSQRPPHNAKMNRTMTQQAPTIS
jgi:hypothetical protein